MNLRAKITGDYDPEQLGRNLEDLLGADDFSASDRRDWVNLQDANLATSEVEDKHF